MGFNWLSIMGSIFSSEMLHYVHSIETFYVCCTVLNSYSTVTLSEFCHTAKQGWWEQWECWVMISCGFSNMNDTFQITLSFDQLSHAAVFTCYKNYWETADSVDCGQSWQ